MPRALVRFYPTEQAFPPEAFGGYGPVSFANSGGEAFMISNGTVRVHRQRHMPGVGWWVLHREDGPAVEGDGPPRYFIEGQEIDLRGEDSESAFVAAIIRHKLKQAETQ